MPVLNIKDQEAYALASRIAAATGRTLTRVVLDALRQEMARTFPRQVDMNGVREILSRMDRIRGNDERSADEIIGYDERGLWL